MNYQLEYTNRKRSISITITPKLEVIVKAPKRTPKTEIDKFINEKTNWITTKLAYFEKNQHKYKVKEFVDGEIHKYLGTEYKLKVIPDEKDAVSIEDGQLIVKNSRITNQFSTKTILSLWYKQQATTYITKKATELFKLFENQVNQFPEISFRKTKSRWGSCSNNGKVAFNPELIKTEPECIDYVITHEFCHLLEHNHSKKFYALLESKMPDYKVWRHKLRELY